MLVSTSKKHSELIDKLVYIAGGDLDVVTSAIAQCANGTGTADLKDVVEWIRRSSTRKPPCVNPSLPLSE